MGMQEGWGVKNVVYASERADVVRCGQCKWGRPCGKLIDCRNVEHGPMTLVKADWFCADGERRDECEMD